MINDVKLQNLIPEELAELLTMENLMLTVHQEKEEQLLDQTSSEERSLVPMSKETNVLSFNLRLRQEEESVEEDEENRRSEGKGKEPSEQEQDFLMVVLTNTSISLVKGRGCSPNSPCQDCGGTRCHLNQVAMVAESKKITLLSRGPSRIFKWWNQTENISIEHPFSNSFLRSLTAQRSPYMSTEPEKITIYYYKTNHMDGNPVVLNFTDSNCFLKCCKDGDMVFLRVETCETQKLRTIAVSDEETLPFVFYMKSTRTRQRQFESASFPGWFIHAISTETVGLVPQKGEDCTDPSFLFVIRK